MMPETGVPTVVEIGSIAAMTDPVLRNYRITQCYYDISSAIAGKLGGHANWCTFATWASKQAGQSIRGEDLDRLRDAILDDVERSGVLGALTGVVRAAGATAGANVRRVLGDALGLDGVLERTSAAVARGNVKVFEEIAPVFAAWRDELMGAPQYDEEAVERFVSRLATGDPPEGQDYLRAAMRSYSRAVVTADEAERAQLILHATLNVGFHEQTRLQPEIAAALDAAIEDPAVVADRIEKALLPEPGWLAKLRRLVRRILGRKTPLEQVVEEVVRHARAAIRPIVTEHMLSIDLAGTPLPLGQDLKQSFPPRLVRITRTDLAGLLARIDPTPDSIRETGARDWADFNERMHFIADLFRAYQEWPRLMGPPFVEDEIAAIRAGRRP